MLLNTHSPALRLGVCLLLASFFGFNLNCLLTERKGIVLTGKCTTTKTLNVKEIVVPRNH